MNWYDRNRSTVSALALSFGLLTPIALGAIFFWAHKTQERLNSNIESQWVKHQTTAQLIRRDIEDLENQIQRTTGRVPVGEFSFFPSPKGLKATHTSLINQSINISTDGARAFETFLDAHQENSFVILNKRLEPVSYSKEARALSMLAASNKAFIDTRAKKPVLFSNFDSPDFQGPDALKTYVHMPHYSFFSSSISGTDLHLLSFVPLKGFWASTISSLAFVLAAVAGSWCLVFGFLIHSTRKQQKVNSWVKKVFEGLRVGKLDSVTLNSSLAKNAEVSRTITESLSEGQTLKKLFAAHWIDETRRLATWTHFSTTLRSWAEGVSIDRETPPKHWLVGSAKVSGPTIAESFSRSLVKSGQKLDIFIFHADEGEINFIVNCENLKSGIKHLKTGVDSFAKFATINSYDFSLSTYFVTQDQKIDSFELLERSLKRARHLAEQSRKYVGTRNVELRSSVSDSVLFFTDATSSKAPQSTIQVVQQAAQKFVAPTKSLAKKRLPVPKARLESTKKKINLPPPPTLQNRIRAKSLNTTNSGRAFVRVSDALGESSWVEVKAQGNEKEV